MRQITYTVGFDHPAAVNRMDHSKPDDLVIDLEAVDIGSLPSGKASVVTLIARAPADLRRALVINDRMPSTKCVELVLDGIPSWRHPPLPAPADESLWQHLVAVSATLEDAGRWVVTIRFTEHVPSGEVLNSISRMMDGNSPSGVGPLAGPTGPGTVTSPAPHLPTVDKRAVHLTRQELRDNSTLRDLGTTGGNGKGQLHIAGIPPIDERSINPIGFRRLPEDGIGEFGTDGHGYYISVANRRLLRLPSSGAVTDVDIERLRSLRGVRGALSGHMPVSKELTRIVIALAAAGVPLVGEVAQRWAAILGEVPVALVRSVTEDDLADTMKREQHSIRLRRWALQSHGVKPRLAHFMAARGVGVIAEPLVSVLLCTRRTAMIEFALRQIARQQGVRFEVILTLHGISKSEPCIASAISRFCYPLSVVEVDASVSFGEALNRGASRASGSFIARMDDDDWYGTDYLSDALLAQRYSGADLVGCYGSFCYLEGSNVTIYKELLGDVSEAPNWMARERIPGDMCLLIPGATIFVSRAAFEAVGGFKPVHIFEDTEFTETIAAAGGRIHRTHGLNFMFRRRDPKKHLWQAPESEFVHNDSTCWDNLYFNELMGIADDEEP